MRCDIKVVNQMEKVRFIFQMPGKNGYTGGIAYIINEYIKNPYDFMMQGFEIGLWDYASCAVRGKSLLNRIDLLIQQRNYIKRVSAIDQCSIAHIQTSRGWNLLKDLCIIHTVLKKLPYKIVVMIHFADYDKILIKNRFVQRFQLRVLKNDVDHLIFLSEKTRTQFVECGVDKGKTSVLYTFHSYEPKEMPEKSKDKVHMLFMGSIDRRKGIIDLLESLDELEENNYILHICGKITDDSLRPRFEELTGRLKNKIELHGYVSGEEKERLFRKTDILVLPSYGEGMPIVIMEAFAMGCAIISTKVGGIPELVTSDNGILVEPGDKNALKEAIKTYCNDRSKLSTTQRHNYIVGKEYSLKGHINSLTNIYKRLK